MVAASQPGLITSAGHIIQMYWSTSLAKLCIRICHNIYMQRSLVIIELRPDYTSIILLYDLQLVEYPSCLQTTLASVVPQ